MDEERVLGEAALIHSDLYFKCESGVLFMLFDVFKRYKTFLEWNLSQRYTHTILDYSNVPSANDTTFSINNLLCL